MKWRQLHISKTNKFEFSILPFHSFPVRNLNHHSKQCCCCGFYHVNFYFCWPNMELKIQNKYMNSVSYRRHSGMNSEHQPNEENRFPVVECCAYISAIIVLLWPLCKWIGKSFSANEIHTWWTIYAVKLANLHKKTHTNTTTDCRRRTHKVELNFFMPCNNLHLTLACQLFVPMHKIYWYSGNKCLKFTCVYVYNNGLFLFCLIWLVFVHSFFFIHSFTLIKQTKTMANQLPPHQV